LLKLFFSFIEVHYDFSKFYLQKHILDHMPLPRRKHTNMLKAPIPLAESFCPCK